MYKQYSFNNVMRFYLLACLGCLYGKVKVINMHVKFFLFCLYLNGLVGGVKVLTEDLFMWSGFLISPFKHNKHSYIIPGNIIKIYNPKKDPPTPIPPSTSLFFIYIFLCKFKCYLKLFFFNFAQKPLPYI